MTRLTITLSEQRYRALKEAAAQRDKTIGQLISTESNHTNRRSTWCAGGARAAS